MTCFNPNVGVNSTDYCSGLKIKPGSLIKGLRKNV